MMILIIHPSQHVNIREHLLFAYDFSYMFQGVRGVMKEAHQRCNQECLLPRAAVCHAPGCPGASGGVSLEVLMML